MLLNVTAILAAISALSTVPASRREADPPASVGPIAPDYRIVIWYDLRRPAETFQAKVFDPREGKYTPAVDEWREMMAARFPRYRAFVRDLMPGDGRGEGKEERLAATIERERAKAATPRHPVVVQPSPRRKTRPSRDSMSDVLRAFRPRGIGGLINPGGPLPSLGPVRSMPRGLSAGPGAGPSHAPYSMPNPLPYPKPHP